jgi:HTH-type transcriptional regulator/antitoxin HigA
MVCVLTDHFDLFFVSVYGYTERGEAVKQKMEEEGLKNKDLTKWIGSKSYVSSLLSGKKPLTLKIAKILHQKLGIPAEVFLA